MRFRDTYLAVSLTCVAAALATGQTSETKKVLAPDDILDRRVAECFTHVQSDEPDKCVHVEKVTIGSLLIDSLSWQSQPIPAGLVLVANDGGSTRFNFKPSGLSVRDILNSVVAADPRYQWSVEGGVVNLSPKSGNPPLLDTRLTEFKRENATTETLFRSLEEMPEVRQRAAELGMSGPLQPLFRIGPVDTRKFTVHCRDCTVRDVLNSIVRQNGDSWMYREHLNEGKKTYRFWYISPQ